MAPKLSNIPTLTDELEEMDERGYREWFAFRGRKELQRALCPGEVGEIASMPFTSIASLGQPSATSSFFSFIPLLFWGQVAVFTNVFAAASGSPSSTPVSLEELMRFLGTLYFSIHKKPIEKYHFKLYVCCCSTSWYAVCFKLHCFSKLGDRMDGVIPRTEVQKLAELITNSSEIHSHVMEVVSSLKGSSGIVNTDNFYPSCLLLEILRSIGLYERGTVRTSSKHFPHFTMIRKVYAKPRGYLKQGLYLEKHIVAASWVDGSIMNVVSNADASTTSTAHRRIKEASVTFTALTCIGEYNSAMQGVDRLDQLRARFSLADGHSFQRWHKKLAMARIDIAR
ncbi:unnamed protein product [Phytophthora fragariaefolia]|uniref:Unnamed protein product n=1 Tax=Phytophthora fragariaefolia TaxID=1490495 RepID=A0A9W6X573_9STRA|nr:unnamed protein product [Phytophthora fragariaefolia]